MRSAYSLYAVKNRLEFKISSTKLSRATVRQIKDIKKCRQNNKIIPFGGEIRCYKNLTNGMSNNGKFGNLHDQINVPDISSIFLPLYSSHQHCNQSKGIHSQKKIRVVSSTRFNGEIKSSN